MGDTFRNQVGPALADLSGGPAAPRGPRRSVVNWCSRQAPGGDAAVAGRRRVRRHSDQRALHPDQETELVGTLCAHHPDELGLIGSLWTRQAVAEIIERSYGIRLTHQSVGRYLRAWGLEPRQPTDRACALCADRVARWLQHEYPAMQRTAALAGARVYWIGRHRLCGVDPVVELVSAVGTRGRLRFTISDRHPGAPSRAEPLTRFLARLVRHDNRPVYAVVDGSWASTQCPRRAPAGVLVRTLPTCARGG